MAPLAWVQIPVVAFALSFCHSGFCKTAKDMPEVGFEPTRTIRPADLKSAPLDLSGIQAKKGLEVKPRNAIQDILPNFWKSHEGKKNALAGNQTRVSSVAGTYTITVLPALNHGGSAIYVHTMTIKCARNSRNSCNPRPMPRASVTPNLGKSEATHSARNPDIWSGA